MGMLGKYAAGNSAWLKSEDMEGWEGPTVIQFADEYELKDATTGATETKAGFTFAQFPEKPYLTNVTNARRLEDIVSKAKGIPKEKIELAHCVGVTVWLYTEPTQTPQGGQVMGIRIKEVPSNFQQMVQNGHASPTGAGVSAPGPQATASDRPPTPVATEPAHMADAPPPPSDADIQAAFPDAQDDVPF